MTRTGDDRWGADLPEATPHVATVTELRRQASQLITRAFKSGRPVYITQCGYATAVLLSVERYENLLRRLGPPSAVSPAANGLEYQKRLEARSSDSEMSGASSGSAVSGPWPEPGSDEADRLGGLYGDYF